ncbi:MAG: tetratricopeptide repeat protein [Thermoguttaceae bacterium]
MKAPRATLTPAPWFGALLALVIVSLGGCRIPGLGGPVSDSLAASRQLSQQGVAAQERGRQRDAERLLAKAVATCPTNAEAHRDYAECLWQRGARPEAMAQLQEACRLTPDDVALRVRQAEMHLVMGELALARASAEQAIALNPRLPAAWAAHGQVLRAAGDPRQALADYQRALGYVPFDQHVLLQVAELYRQMNQPQRALETLQNLADTYNTPAEEPQQVLYLMGLAYVALRRYDDGVQSFAAAAAHERPTPEILYQLAQAQWLAGHAAEAAATAQRALAMDPQHQPSRELLDRLASQTPLRR